MVAFHRLIDLKDALQRAVYTQRDEIVAAQVGAAKGKKKTELERSARASSRVILDPAFWDSLEIAANDLEPIAFMTNINQADATRPDQVLLSLAGLFLHFAAHATASVRNGMLRRIEKRWSGLDQAVFTFALILNPYEGVQRFGDKAAINVFMLDTELITVQSPAGARLYLFDLASTALSSLQLATLARCRNGRTTGRARAATPSKGEEGVDRFPDVLRRQRPLG